MQVGGTGRRGDGARVVLLKLRMMAGATDEVKRSRRKRATDGGGDAGGDAGRSCRSCGRDVDGSSAWRAAARRKARPTTPPPHKSLYARRWSTGAPKNAAWGTHLGPRARRSPAPLSKHDMGGVGPPPTPITQRESGLSALIQRADRRPPLRALYGCGGPAATCKTQQGGGPVPRSVPSDPPLRPPRTLCAWSLTTSLLEPAADTHPRRPDLAGRPPSHSPSAL